MQNNTNITFQELKERLSCLSIFTHAYDDPILKIIINQICDSFNEKEYANAISRLYEFNGGDLSKYINSFCQNDDNSYLKNLALNKRPTEEMKVALEIELATMQRLAELSYADFAKNLSCNAYLSQYSISKVNISDTFNEICKNVKTCGFGIYRNSAFFEILDDNIIAPISSPDPIRLSDLSLYKRERTIVINNTIKLINSQKCQNVLLSGDAGCGKSSLVKAIVNEYSNQGLRIIQIRKSQISKLHNYVNQLKDNPLKFIFFIDDISFSCDDETFGELKMLLEGSLSTLPPNIVIYATSNRRHIVKEKFSDRDGDEIHVNDSIQEMISLSDRFGIQVTFSRPDKKSYLEIVSAIANKNSLDVSQDLLNQAEQFALTHGGRSGRSAKQFIDEQLSIF